MTKPDGRKPLSALPDNQRLGRLGENLAAAHLRGHGWLILARNWRCRSGEIDIVALDGPHLVVCEVKTRLSERAGAPVESVTGRKLKRLRVLALEWLAQRGGEDVDSLRVDVIGIRIDAAGRHRVHHLRGVA